VRKRWDSWQVSVTCSSVGPLVAGLGIGIALHGHWWGCLLIAAGSALLVPYWVREYGPAIRRRRARRRAAAAAIHHYLERAERAAAAAGDPGEVVIDRELREIMRGED
jgi:hypothetical protein